MPYCPNCKILSTGGKCPRCGMVLTQAQTQPPPPPPPPQQQQYQQPPPPTRPAQLYTQQPQTQPTYQAPPTAPAAAPTTPPKKSKKGAVAVVIIVVAILVIASLAFLFIFQEGENGKGGGGEIPTITFQELNSDLEIDIDSLTMTYKSYDAGDELYVVGTVDNIRMANVPSGVFGIESGLYTIIFFEMEGISPFYNFAYKGDIQSDYTIGEEGTIKIKIEEMMGTEYPAEAMTANMIEEYIEVPDVTLQFTETSPGNYTGSVTSSSDIVLLKDLEIEIYDASEDDYGDDDWDLTDDDPELIESYWIDAYLEFHDINDDDKLDSGDTFIFRNAEPGDKVILRDKLVEDPDTYEYKIITEYTLT